MRVHRFGTGALIAFAGLYVAAVLTGAGFVLVGLLAVTVRALSKFW